MNNGTGKTSPKLLATRAFAVISTPSLAESATMESALHTFRFDVAALAATHTSRAR